MKKTFEIILIIVGLILGSMARISTHLTPAHIDVKTNQDVKNLEIKKVKEDPTYVLKVTKTL